MEKDDVVKYLLDKKVTTNNSIDLNAYAIGAGEMFDVVKYRKIHAHDVGRGPARLLDVTIDLNKIKICLVQGYTRDNHRKELFVNAKGMYTIEKDRGEPRKTRSLSNAVDYFNSL